MRRFLAGLLLGIASMYWFAYEKEAFFDSVKGWFSDAARDADARVKVDNMFSRRH